MGVNPKRGKGFPKVSLWKLYTLIALLDIIIIIIKKIKILINLIL